MHITLDDQSMTASRVKGEEQPPVERDGQKSKHPEEALIADTQRDLYFSRQ